MKLADIKIVAFDFEDEYLMRDLEWRVNEVLPELRAEAELRFTATIPKGAFQSRRRQYLAPAFLDALELLPLSAARVLGVTDVDIYAPDLHYVFGQARIMGREGVISLTRLREEFYGKIPSREVLLRRARVEAVHELGHTFGLEHCHNHHCVMFLSNGIAHTDRKSDEYCEVCRAELTILIGKFLSQGVR